MRSECGPSGQRARLPIACALGAATLIALILRTYGTSVPFHSGDYASMPYMVSRWHGVAWILAHIHGPLLPAMDWLFARAAVAVRLIMNETMWRLPLALVGTLHVIVTYYLMRRLRAAAWTSLLAAALTAVLPLLTSDARYPWGYETLAVCVGSLAIWAWLRDLDRPTWYGHWFAGGLLGLYLVSHLVIHAVPLVIAAAALLRLGPRGGMRRLVHPSTIVPVALAAGCTFYAWFALHGGIVGRMSRHIGQGTLNAGAYTFHDALRLGCQLVGPIWLTWCAVAVVVGLVLLARRDRRGLPALWAVVYAAPLMLLLNVNNIGRPAVYQVQWVYSGSLAGCILLQVLVDGCRAWTPRPRAMAYAALGSFGLLMVTAHLLGSISNLFRLPPWPALTGTVDYGRMEPDPGFKAAAWYIRTYVPGDAVILATHGTTGMEYPLALYYLGRHVAAAEDTTDAQECRIIDGVRNDIDVAIVEPRFLERFSPTTGFTTPVRILRDGEPILYIAARKGYELRPMDVNVAGADAEYDRAFPLRRVPSPITSLPRTASVNQRILAILNETAGERSGRALTATTAEHE